MCPLCFFVIFAVLGFLCHHCSSLYKTSSYGKNSGKNRREEQGKNLCLRVVKKDFALNTRVTRINKKELLMLDNPRYTERIAYHSHLYGVEIEDQSLEERLPVHIILGANKYAQIRTRTPPRGTRS